MKLFILGPVRIEADGRDIAIGRRRERLVLGLLALRNGNAISSNGLAEDVWTDNDRPDNARTAIQISISRLRRVLSAHGHDIVARGNTYALATPLPWIDATEFRAQVQGSARLGSPAGRSAALADALTLWRGTPLEDVTAAAEMHVCTAGLRELHNSALENRIAADLDCGRHAQVVPELRGLVATNPIHEGFLRLFMIALTRSGRQAEALRVYEHARSAMAEHLGAGPEGRLVDLNTRILRGDRLDGAVSSGPAEPQVRMLPRSVPALIGRDSCLW